MAVQFSFESAESAASKGPGLKRLPNHRVSDQPESKQTKPTIEGTPFLTTFFFSFLPFHFRVLTCAHWANGSPAPFLGIGHAICVSRLITNSQTTPCWLDVCPRSILLRDFFDSGLPANPVPAYAFRGDIDETFISSTSQACVRRGTDRPDFSKVEESHLLPVLPRMNCHFLHGNETKRSKRLMAVAILAKLHRTPDGLQHRLRESMS
ncbi:hypothetical protein VTN31DRAFT_3774 [Thermomyces dupontii]|uniref:uncharacterized protein n=1 Tax=Talaromyces thermophilus TaxID=28565 RepID=UPI0037428F2E